MTKTTSDPAAESEIPSFEVFPELAADADFINLANQAYALKLRMDQDKAEMEKLRLQLGGRARAVGVSSIRFLNLIITNAKGSDSPGDVEIPKLREALLAFAADPTRVPLIIAEAATKVDPAELLRLGVPAHIIEASRGPRKVVSGSTQFSLAGSKKKKEGAPN